MAATVGALALVSAKSGLTVWVRWTKSATASYCESVTRSGKRLRLGSESGGMANTCSACTCSSTWLVTSSLRLRQAASSSASGTAASITCSQLSKNSSICLSLRAEVSSERGACPLRSLIESVRMMVGSTCSGSVTGANGTRTTPSANWSTSSAATCSPSRVLTRPTSARRSSPHTVATSRSRPMKGVGWIGKLCRWASRVRSWGKSAGRPAMTS